MPAFPTEFADLLTPKGLRILRGRDPEACGALLRVPPQRFISLTGVINVRKAVACRDALEEELRPTLTPMEDPIPPESILGMTENYAELLPKTVRVRTALLESRRSRSWHAAERVGLTAMLRSESFAAFASAVSGRTLRRKWGIQVLCYGPGDYSGPHNDHHPEDLEARDGYVDMHVSLATPAVAHQWLIYAKGGHFSEMTPVNTVGGVTVYRLPFWHYTTPLMARPGAEADARRWVLLGTFLDAPRKPERVSPGPRAQGR
ncbi:hypothetical protein [Hyalangium rubrum]|uniref:Prolyl 4-hydroxylase alpha subunit domain-containing protein n=1 Tax=Hyalangium rubrum TaxID=3103134 RepID=A0ABU5GWR7_9BACT|nr:hypothetical protein [Hyalangium sp. s54d21]MDY7225635.1 hypothetical protein [Hyalangium sp. s54d21]